MRTTAALVAALIVAPVALAEEPGDATLPAPSPARPDNGGKPMNPAQKTAALEEMLERETDRRVDLDAKVAALAQENNRMVSAQAALARDKASPTASWQEHATPWRVPSATSSRLRGEYTRTNQDRRPVSRTHRTRRPAHLCPARLAPVITRKLAVRVHDVPTLAKIQDTKPLSPGCTTSSTPRGAAATC